MFPNDYATTSDDATQAQEPVHVASVLRRLQALTLAERTASIALEVDESLHIAADARLLLAALEDVVGRTIAGARGDDRVVVRCRAEESGVVIEVEDEHELASYQTDVTLARATLAIETMGGQLARESHPEEGQVVALHFPLLLKRAASSRPAVRRVSGMVPAVGEPPPRKTGDGSF